jgi:Crp-like helix-turn-helix domain
MSPLLAHLTPSIALRHENIRHEDMRHDDRRSVRDVPTRSPISIQCFNRRDFLPSHYRSLWQIESGIVRTVTWDDSGNTVPLGFWGQGDIVGYPLATVIPCQIECLTWVKAQRLPDSFICPPDVLISHICQTQTLLKISHTISMEKRLLEFLVWIFQRFGHQVERGWQLSLRLTHLDIAEALGTTRVTVTRLIGQLQQSGIIQWSRREQILYNSSNDLLLE